MPKQYPSTRTLERRLPAMLARRGVHRDDIKIVARTAATRSTFPTDIVTCRIGGHEPVKLWCKYSHPQRHHLPSWHVAHGHRHGVAYESRVYRDVLEPLGMTTPPLWGAAEDRDRRACLAIEYLEESVRVTTRAAYLTN